jgi:hypothetical protein
MFEGWDNFYLLIGGAAGGLIGLLFIVVTLMGGGQGALKLRAASIYMTPNVAHLAMLLTLSALAAAPRLADPARAILVIACAIACLAFTGRALLMLGAGAVKASHWSDWWGYGVFPFLACLGLGGSAAAAWVAPEWAARGIAASMIAMLLLAVRNAWDLVTWITAKGDSLTANDKS